MISLEKISGLPVQMRDDYSLVFEKGLPPVTPNIREFSSMKNYLKDSTSSYYRRDVYHMYRDISLPDHTAAVREANLEYDITVIPPGMIGQEFVKTIGHYHPFKPGTNIRYPEVYEVLYGKVFLLIQNASLNLQQLQRVILVEANRGEKILVPPGYGHASINPTSDVLVLANWQPLNNKGLYEPYEDRVGAAYYVMQSQRLGASGETSLESEFLPNLHYDQLPSLERVTPRDLPQYDLLSALPMYFTGTRNLPTLEFLTAPEKYLDELVPEKLFKS